MDNTFNENKKILLKELWVKLPKKDKAKLKRYFQSNGLCQASVYRRFSSIGFQPWEYEGVKKILDEYGISIPRNKSKLWDLIKPKEKFYKYMYEKGMSRPTVNHRFRSFNFENFEIRGVKSVLEEYIDKSYLEVDR